MTPDDLEFLKRYGLDHVPSQTAPSLATFGRMLGTALAGLWEGLESEGVSEERIKYLAYALVSIWIGRVFDTGRERPS